MEKIKGGTLPNECQVVKDWEQGLLEQSFIGVREVIKKELLN